MARGVKFAKQPELFLVTKEFTSGLLKGLTIKERTEIRFIVGRHYKGICGSSNYVVRAVIPWSDRVAEEFRKENAAIDAKVAQYKAREGK